MPRNVARLTLALGVALAIAAAADAAPSRKPASDWRHTVARARELMGTSCTVVAEGADSNHVARTIARAFDDIARLESVLSGWRNDSEVARLNGTPAQIRTPLSRDLCDALSRALALAEETEGAFDPTIEALTLAWDLRGPGKVPDRLELNDARSRTGWRRVNLEHGTCSVWFQRDRLGLDFGGIERGLALERVEHVLRGAGVERALVRFGDDVLSMSDAKTWIVRASHPVERGRPMVEMAARTGAFSTACQAERGFRANGFWYGHVIDPASGAPLATDASVTVVTRLAARADALSIALLVIGREGAERFAAEHPDVGVLWLEPDGSGVRAWRWNLPAATEVPGAQVDWRN